MVCDEMLQQNESNQSKSESLNDCMNQQQTFSNNNNSNNWNKRFSKSNNDPNNNTNPNNPKNGSNSMDINARETQYQSMTTQDLQQFVPAMSEITTHKAL